MHSFTQDNSSQIYVSYPVDPWIPGEVTALWKQAKPELWLNCNRGTVCSSWTAGDVGDRQGSSPVPGKPGFSLCLGPMETSLSPLRPQEKALGEGGTGYADMFYVCDVN